MSKRLDTLKALCDHLAGITPANGYAHDLTDRVWRGRSSFGAETPIPCLNLLEPLNPDREPRATDGGRVQKEQWVLLLQGWAVDDDANPTDPAHLLMADVKKRLAVLMDDGYPAGNPMYMLGGKIADLAVEPGTVRPPDENSARAFFYIRIVLSYAEDLSDP
jgi:hypothetical protein